MSKFAVILSGCGVYDGAEIHESVSALIAIKRAGADYRCFAPDIDQYHVINHITGKPTGETRSVLQESARIARGKILPLSEYDPSQFDALLIPGGFGAAKNLSTIAFDGPNAKVNRDVRRALELTHKQGKPIGAMCISPAVVAKALTGVTVTVGDDPETECAIKAMGGQTKKASHAEVVVDEENKVFTTPCYMLDADIAQIADGADNLVKAMLTAIS